MDREEFMRELEDMFQDEPDNNKLNVVLDLADAYVEYEYEERKKSEKVQWGKDVCAAAGEDTDEFPEQVFVSISEKLEDRMLENNGDLEYAVVQEVVNEFWEHMKMNVIRLSSSTLRPRQQDRQCTRRTSCMSSRRSNVKEGDDGTQDHNHEISDDVSGDDKKAVR